MRVSAKDQDTNRQIYVLSGFGIPAVRILQDKQPGRGQAGYSTGIWLKAAGVYGGRIFYHYGIIHEMLEKCRNGGVIVIRGLDRFRRDHDEIIKEWRMITGQNRAGTVASDIPMLDTRQKENDLTSRSMADLILQTLSYISHIEREKNRCRQTEGIRLTRERGTKFGRPAKLVAAIYP